jgi:hypothetical protein
MHSQAASSCRKAALLPVLLLACTPALGSGHDAKGFGATYGEGNDARRAGAIWELPLLERPRRTSGTYTLALELGVSRWGSRGSYDNDAWQVSAVPFLRIWNTDGYYGEIGIGASAYSETRVGDVRLGSAFQFCNHIGVGRQFKGRHRIGLRLSHFSNGGIVEPNEGLDVWQLTYTRLY